MIRQVNKKTSQLQGTFIAGYGGQKPQRVNTVDNAKGLSSKNNPGPVTPKKRND